MSEHPKHLGDPLQLAIADAIGSADMDVIVGSFMPAGERWELAGIIATAVRQWQSDHTGGSDE